jgi:protein TonB
MFGEVCPTPVEDTIPMVEKDTVNKQELPELPQDMGLIEITPISGEIITVKDSLTEKDSLTDVLEVAAVMPEFPGGAQELMKFISAKETWDKVASSFDLSLTKKGILFNLKWYVV